MCELNNEKIYDVDSDGNSIEEQEVDNKFDGIDKSIRKEVKREVESNKRLTKLFATRAGNFIDIYKAVLDIQEQLPESIVRTELEYRDFFREDVKQYGSHSKNIKQLPGYKRIKYALKMYNILNKNIGQLK